MDVIGAPVLTTDFVVAGSSSQNLYGMAESRASRARMIATPDRAPFLPPPPLPTPRRRAVYRPDMSPEELFETISQVLLSAQDRDAKAGWGAVVHVITAEGVLTRDLKARMD